MFRVAFVIFALNFCLGNEDIVVEIKQGRIQGVQETGAVNLYYSFKGIPYAEPPVGDLRFKPPVPHKGWKGVYKATKHGNICPQFDTATNEDFAGDEDCLFLNVYTPTIQTSEEPRAVMFWIYGDFFRHGSGNSDHYFGPDYFMRENVILVTLNFRLGVLGFLDLEDEVIPGNMGLKDIILALKWVQENIENFGGDAKRVTIFGNGSGGVAVDILTLSEATKGLFNRAICQSGVSLMSSYLGWGPRERAFELAKILQQNPTDSSSLLKGFSKVKPIDFVESLSKTIHVDEAENKQFGILPFSATISKHKKDAIITEYPEEIFLKGVLSNPNVSIMFGFNSQESILSNKFLIQRPQFLKQQERKFQFLFPLRDIYAKYDSHYYHEVIYRLRDFYFNGTVDITKESVLEEYLSFMSDLHVYPIDKTVRAYVNASTAPIYYYRFSYDGGLNYFKDKSTEQMYDDYPVDVDGASERDEICYLFKCNVIRKAYEEAEREADDPDVIMIHKMVRLWTNFAKTGNPTPEDDDLLEGLDWQPAVKDWQNFLDIGDNLTMAFSPHFKNINFWDLMYEHYGSFAIDGVIGDKLELAKDEL